MISLKLNRSSVENGLSGSSGEARVKAAQRREAGRGGADFFCLEEAKKIGGTAEP